MQRFCFVINPSKRAGILQATVLRMFLIFMLIPSVNPTSNWWNYVIIVSEISVEIYAICMIFNKYMKFLMDDSLSFSDNARMNLIFKNWSGILTEACLKILHNCHPLLSCFVLTNYFYDLTKISSIAYFQTTPQINQLYRIFKEDFFSSFNTEIFDCSNFEIPQ